MDLPISKHYTLYYKYNAYSIYLLSYDSLYYVTYLFEVIK